MRDKGKNLKLTIKHHVVNYNDEGPDEAPVIIFIHGFPLNKSMWDLQVEALKDDYRVITYDVRGHGGSAGNGNFSMDVFGNDLIDLMDRLEVGTATLCGFSMGGYIALNAIGKYPHSFNALVLADTQCKADTPEGRERRMEAIESIRKNGIEQYADESVKNLFAPESVNAKPAEVAAVKKMITDTAENSLGNTLRALSERKEMCNKLPRINVPVLIMVGKEDKITPLADARLMHEKIQDASLVVIDHAGHVANIEHPDEFNKHLKKFMHRINKVQVDLAPA